MFRDKSSLRTIIFVRNQKHKTATPEADHKFNCRFLKLITHNSNIKP